MGIDNLGKLRYDSASKYSIQIVNDVRGPKDTDGNSSRIFDATNEQLNIALKSINMVTYSDASVETYVNDEYIITRGREDIKEITFTFNDFDSLTLYKSFERFYNVSKNMYPIDQYFIINIFHDNDRPGNFKQTTIRFDDCIMTALSALEFNHSVQNEILDFSVGFKCGDPTYETS